MPRTNICTPPEERALAAQIRELYGNMLSAREVGAFLGLKNVKTYTAILEGVPSYEFNGRQRYFAADVAKKIWEART